MKNSFVGLMAGVVLLTACGGTGPAVDRNSGGTGSLTLLVDARIDASDVGTGFVTDFRVDLQDTLGNAVSGATVTVKTASAGTLTLVEAGAGSGRYETAGTMTPEGDFELDVVSGTDEVRGVILGGPGIHTITAPVTADTLVEASGFLVTWDFPSQAKFAVVEARGYSSNDIVDDGEYMVPANSFDVRNDQRIRVFRFNEVEIAGGLPGSRLRVEVRKTVEPILSIP
ncbi:MAG: hypothetical protein OEZ54_04480 [Gemmatimonadota bacterium]|nr:hypothetical protein [Gemmatimonadota bacterium]